MPCAILVAGVKSAQPKRLLYYLYDLRRETMWNQFRTDEYEGMLAETVTMAGHNGDLIHAYLSRCCQSAIWDTF
jgi:hypothetical protein